MGSSKVKWCEFWQDSSALSSSSINALLLWVRILMAAITGSTAPMGCTQGDFCQVDIITIYFLKLKLMLLSHAGCSSPKLLLLKSPDLNALPILCLSTAFCWPCSFHSLQLFWCVQIISLSLLRFLRVCNSSRSFKYSFQHFVLEKQ